MISNFFSFLQALVLAEGRAIRYGIIFMCVTVLLASCLQIILDGGNTILVISIILIFLNAWWLFAPRRLLSVFGVGETAEILKIFPAKDGFPPNQMGEIYWRTVKNVFYFLTVYMLLIPFIPLREWWPSAIVFPFLFILLGVFFGASGRALVQWAGKAVVCFLFLLFLSNIFPQLAYYTGWEKIVGNIASSRVAKLANETDRLRVEQRGRMVEDAQRKILDWQKDNPGKELPQGDDLLLNLEVAKKGLSLSEYQDELKKAKEAQEKAAVAAKEKADADAKAKALEKIRQDAERQEAEANAKNKAEAERETKKAEAERRKQASVLNLSPTVASSGPYKMFNLPSSTNYGDSFEFLEAVPLIGQGGGSIFIGGSSVGSFPSVIPAGFKFKIPSEALKKGDCFEIAIFNSNPQNINQIKLKKKGGV